MKLAIYNISYTTKHNSYREYLDSLDELWNYKRVYIPFWDWNTFEVDVEKYLNKNYGKNKWKKMVYLGYYDIIYHIFSYSESQKKAKYSRLYDKENKRYNTWIDGREYTQWSRNEIENNWNDNKIVKIKRQLVDQDGELVDKSFNITCKPI